MNEYMFFISNHNNNEKTLSHERLHQFPGACEAYIYNLKQQGVLLSAKPIYWTGKIMSVRNDGWKETNNDETGEVIAGYYHILANDINEAIEIAKANPEFTYNKDPRIEVRLVKTKEEHTGFVYPSESI
jgi:hypothetical protein